MQNQHLTICSHLRFTYNIFFVAGGLLTLTFWANASLSHSVLIIKHKQLTSSSLMKYSFEFLDIGCCSCLEQVQVCVSHCKLQQTIRFSDMIHIVLKSGCFRPKVSPRLCPRETIPCRFLLSCTSSALAGVAAKLLGVVFKHVQG